MDNLFRVVLSLIAKNQKASKVVQYLYRCLSSLIFRFSKRFFFLNSNSIAELCLEIMKHCNCKYSQLRKDASTLLFLLLKKNYEESKSNFSRMKSQTTIALSKLVGQVLDEVFYIFTLCNLYWSVLCYVEWSILEKIIRSNPATSIDYRYSNQTCSWNLST